MILKKQLRQLFHRLKRQKEWPATIWSLPYISVGGAHIHSQNSHGVVAVSDPSGEITQNDVDRAIEAASAVSLPASREVIHVLPREFIVDGESGVRDAVGMSGVRLEVDTHIISAGSSALKNLKKAIAEVGIQMEDLVFSGLASAESVVSSTEKELGCVLIDIGAGTTSIAAYHRRINCLFRRNSGWGQKCN